MENDIFLTIGIPTFNGVEYLPLAIESIIRQIPKDEVNNFEILISDNASTDQTKEIVLDFQRKFPKLIRYIRNDNNLGYDKNLDSLIRNSKGKYIKLLGDDDELLLNSIVFFKNQILENPELIAIVHSVKFVDMKTGIEIISDHNISLTKIYSDRDEFFQETRWATAALSRIIILRESWMNCNLQKYMGTNQIHLGGLIEILRKPGFSMAISSPLAVVRLNNDRWVLNYNSEFNASLDHSKVMRNLLFTGYKKSTHYQFVKDRFRLPIEEVVKLHSYNLFKNFKTSVVFIRQYWFIPKYLKKC